MTAPTSATPETSDSRRATLVGLSAVLMWALLAWFTDLTGTVPPFQLTAMTFAIGALACLAACRWQGRWPRFSWSRPGALVAGTAGLFLYHVFYFTALRHAPAVDASLIAYLWPLLIVIGSALLPGEKLGLHHIIGAMAGLAGAALIVTGGTGLSFRSEFAFGYLMAFLCAFTWSSYSLSARHFKALPTDNVILFCTVTAILSFILHRLFEQSVVPPGPLGWAGVVGLGLLPVGLAFFTWDHGCKRGNIQVLGALSYLTPLLSTLVLVAVGRAQPGWVLALACLLITFGAMIAAKDMILKRSA